MFKCSEGGQTASLWTHRDPGSLPSFCISVHLLKMELQPLPLRNFTGMLWGSNDIMQVKLLWKLLISTETPGIIINKEPYSYMVREELLTFLDLKDWESLHLSASTPLRTCWERSCRWSGAFLGVQFTLSRKWGCLGPRWHFILCELVYLCNYFKFKNHAKWMSFSYKTSALWL